MTIIVWIVFGLVVGLLARAIMPGRQAMGLVATTLLGIAGSLLGGFVGSWMMGSPPLQFDGSGLFGSLFGALAILFVIGLVNKGKQR